MKKNILVTILIIACICITSGISEAKTKKYCKDIWVNNTNCNDIKIEVLDVDLLKEPVYIDKDYLGSAILTMKITNKGIYDMELSNIDIYPYQGKEPTKYFVKTSDDDVTGFSGNLRSGESKKIKVGVALNNISQPIKMQLSNIEDREEETVIESIRLK